MASTKLVSIVFALLIAGGMAEINLHCSGLIGVTQCLLNYLGHLVGSNVPCDPVVNNVLGLLPTDTQNLLANLTSSKCALDSCGTPNGSGYFDIYCNAQCVLALYESGTCGNNGTYQSCTCTGRNGIAFPQASILFTVCELIGSCACQTCKNSTASSWSKGTCYQVPNGVVNKCS